MKFNKKDLLLIPNILTYIRFLSVPFFVWMILDVRIPNHQYIAFGLFMAASFTDVVDGFIARQFKMTSDIGKIIDPMADKLLQVTTLLGLTLIGNIEWVFPVIYFIKEAYLVIGGCYIINVMKSNYVLQSNFFGKSATWLNSLGIVLAFFVDDVNAAYDTAVFVILAIGATFAIITAIIYTYSFRGFRSIELEQNGGVKYGFRDLFNKKVVGDCGENRDELCGDCESCNILNPKCDKTLKINNTVKTCDCNEEDKDCNISIEEKCNIEKDFKAEDNTCDCNADEKCEQDKESAGSELEGK